LRQSIADNRIEEDMTAVVIGTSAGVWGRRHSALLQGLAGVLALLAVLLCAISPAAAQESAADSAAPTIKQIASDLYFFYEYSGSNAVFLTTEEGVLVIDTRQHPRAGQDLLERIRKITNKPIRWVINSHFHGDHTFGNAAFKKEGATFVAHAETARLMQLVQPKEMARRGAYFTSHHYDPGEVKLILPDVQFDSTMTSISAAVKCGCSISVLASRMAIRSSSSRTRGRFSRPDRSQGTACRTWRSRHRSRTG
jgi:hypothetical protein